MPPVNAATAVTRPVSASDDRHMCALVAAGARQKISREDRRDEPGKHHQFDRARRAAHDQIDRKRRQRDDAAEQPRRDEGAMTRRRQRILLRRRMHQRLDIVSYRREQAHVPDARPALQTRSPFSVAGSCQTALKRTAKAAGRTRARKRCAAALPVRISAVMVNGPLPPNAVAICLTRRGIAKSRATIAPSAACIARTRV